jgi:7,8-dihydropterin-6-yl-methyl-4-(beta-D-ribofuranosyl)aminobenzene 5'-phosphate synthase
VLTLTVVYDNISLSSGLKGDWGFACLVSGLERSILFDTGADGGILLHNLTGLGHPPEEIEMVLLSHEHKDHIGGLLPLLEKNPGIEVWAPDHFSDAFFERLDSTAVRCVRASTPRPLCPHAHTTGIVTGWIKEQSLVLETPRGLVLITGCAHPRLVKILELVHKAWDRPVYQVLGGFHLGGFKKQELREISNFARKVGVRKVGPAHCTGEEAKESFKNAFPDGYIEMGVGKEITIP